MPDHIQIPPVAPRIQYVANGSQTEFPYPFPIFTENDLSVWLDAARHAAGYTVTNIGNTDGGGVIFDTAPITGTVVTLERRLNLQRMGDFLEGGDFSADAINTELDYLTACLQQINNDAQPMLRFDSSEEQAETVIPGKTSRAGKVLGFDGSGNPAMFDTADTYSVPGYTASGTGAVTRSLTDKAREIVSVKDFGAVGDGITDDTTAILAALAAHDSLFLPSGTYLISAAIILEDNKNLFGAGGINCYSCKFQ